MLAPPSAKLDSTLLRSFLDLLRKSAFSLKHARKTNVCFAAACFSSACFILS